VHGIDVYDSKICLFSDKFLIFITHHDCLAKIAKFVYKKYPPISGKLSITNYLKYNAIDL